jgi:hypothetical protein
MAKADVWLTLNLDREVVEQLRELCANQIKECDNATCRVCSLEQAALDEIHAVLAKANSQ